MIGRAFRVTTTPLAEGIVEKVRRTLGALVVGEIRLAVALARERIARLSDRARLVALTRKTIRILVVAGRALIAFRSAAAFLARALLLIAVVRARRTSRSIHVAFTCLQRENSRNQINIIKLKLKRKVFLVISNEIKTLVLVLIKFACLL